MGTVGMDMAMAAGLGMVATDELGFVAERLAIYSSSEQRDVHTVQIITVERCSFPHSDAAQLVFRR